MSRIYNFVSILIVIICLAGSNVIAADRFSDDFPRLMGMNIGEKHYHKPAYQVELAKLDIVILGFYKGWQPTKGYSIGRAVRDLQARNARLLIGQYSVLNEARDVFDDKAMDDVKFKLASENWWLRNAAGERVQWTSNYSAWETNFTRWAKPDKDGMRYPQWSVKHKFHFLFRDNPQFRIWYTDNIFHRPRVTADWDGDGLDDNPDDPRILKAWRSGYRDWWAQIRKLDPSLLIMGNTDSDLSQLEFKDQLDGAFLEGLMGLHWSIEARKGWYAMMKRYLAVSENLRGPKIVGFNVSGNPKNYQFFRYAYSSCLLGDGYFSFTDESEGHSTVPWFDEYDVKLGKALSQPPTKPWQQNVWRRDFEYGVVLVNPSSVFTEVNMDAGFSRFIGVQDPSFNDGSAVQRFNLAPKDGIVLVRDKFY